MDRKGDLVYNKDLWILASGTFLKASSELVTHELKRAEKQLFQGINHFHLHKPDPDAENELRNTSTNQLYLFIQNLEVLLGINVIQVYDLLCYYVMYEFRGSFDGMHQLIVNDVKKTMLIHDIWLFYRSERMFLLKCINLIWSYYADSDHPYQELYGEFITTHNLYDTFNCHASQLETVTNEKIPTTFTHGHYMTSRFQNFWFIANLREQIEVIHNLILYLDFYDCTSSDFETLFSICQHHSFGRDQQPGKTLIQEHNHLKETIGLMETILLLKALNLESIDSTDYKLFTDVAAFERLDTAIGKLGTSKEHGPVLIAWMVINYMAPHKDPEFGHYRRFGDKAVEAQVFDYLTKLLSHSIFQYSTKLGTIAFECVSKLLHQMTITFESDILVCLPGAYGLVAAVLKDSKVTQQFWRSDRNTGLWTAVNAAIKEFPVQYYPLVNIVESLASCGPMTMPQLTEKMSKLPSYMSNVGSETPALYELVMPGNSVNSHGNPLVWKKCHSYMKEIDGSIDWLNDTNFYRIIHKQLNSLLEQIASGNNYVQVETTNQAIASVKCLHQLIENRCAISKELSDAIGVVFHLLDKFSFYPRPSSELVGGFINVASALFISFPAMVLKRFEFMAILPKVDILKCTNPIKLACGEHFHLNTVGMVMADHECFVGRYPLLLAYLRFVLRVMEPHGGESFDYALEKNLDIILPGLILVVRVVFPNHASWPYEDEMDKIWITHHCIRILHNVLSVTASPEVMSTPKEPGATPKLNVPNLLHTISLYSLLETDTCLPLLRLVASGDRYIQSLMERQPSWLVGSGILFIGNVQLGMSVLNRVLLLKPTIHKSKRLCQIETLLYCQPTPSSSVPSGPQLRVVLVVANYIYHCFNHKLPILAVKLLKRFAAEFPISLMSCLGSDGHVICQSILARLFSPIESDEIKVAILELVSASVSRQPCLIESFVNLHNTQLQECEKGGCLIFVCKILDNLITAPSTVPVIIHEGVINLIYALWMGETQTVLYFLRARATFWNGLCAPFFLDLRKDELHVYCKILSIITLELFWYRGKVGHNLEKNLLLLFNDEMDYMSHFSKFISSQIEEMKVDGLHNPIVDGLLTAWKEFLTVSTTFFPFRITRKVKLVITKEMMEILHVELKTMKKPTLIKLVADLYLHLIMKWKDDCFENRNHAVEQLRQLVIIVSSTYQSLPYRCNEVLLSLIIRQLDCLYHDIRSDEVVTDSLMRSCCAITSLELLSVSKVPNITDEPEIHSASLEKHVNKNPPRPSLTCTLSVCLMQKLIFTMVGRSLWNTKFHHSKFVNLLLDTTSFALQNVEVNFSLAVVALNTLMVLTNTKFSRTLVMFDVGSKLWLLALPPTRESADEKMWYETKWVKIYEPVLRIVTSLLITHRHHFVEEAISFVGIHHHTMMGILTAIRTSLHHSTLQMAITTLELLRILREYKPLWKLSHSESFYDLNKCVMVTLDTCVAFLTQPHLMYVLVDQPVIRDKSDLAAIKALDIEPSKPLNHVQNRLVECASWCISVMYPLGPSFVEMLTELRDPDHPRELLIDLNFTSPILYRDTFGTLSFGTLITLVNICTQALAYKPVTFTQSPSRSCSSPTKVFRPSDKWVSSLNRNMTTFALELSLSTILSQGLIAIGGDFLTAHGREFLSTQEKKHIEREIMTEMALYMDNMKRNTLADQGELIHGGNDGRLKRPSDGRKHCVRRLQLSPPPVSKLVGTDDNPEPLQRIMSRVEKHPIEETLIIMSSFMEIWPPKTTILNIGSQYEEFSSHKFFQLVAHVLQCIFR